MKTAVCYYSRHHGNTLRVLQAMAGERELELIDVTSRIAVHLEDYDCIGFASGIYYAQFQETVLQFARQYLPREKAVFFVYTYGFLRRGRGGGRSDCASVYPAAKILCGGRCRRRLERMKCP